MGNTGGGRDTNGDRTSGASAAHRRRTRPEASPAEPLTNSRPQRLSTARQVQLLTDLMDRLVATNQKATIYLIGGVAAGMAYYPDGVDRRTSIDIDAIFSPHDVVAKVAAEIADEHGLRRDWFNDKAGGFLPPSGKPQGLPLISAGEVVVHVAPPEFLLAMKLRASRMGRDDEDIAVLVRRCGISSIEQAQALVDDVYLGEEEIPHRGHLILSAVLGEYELTRSDPQIVLPPVRTSSP